MNFKDFKKLINLLCAEVVITGLSKQYRCTRFEQVDIADMGCYFAADFTNGENCRIEYDCTGRSVVFYHRTNDAAKFHSVTEAFEFLIKKAK